MLFSSPTFFIFFAVYFAFHVLVPRRYQIYLVICGSTIFYASWKVEYVWLPYLLMAIAYLGVRWVDRSRDLDTRRRRMTITIIVLFLPLIVFKYTDFVYVDVFGPLFGVKEKVLNVSLPLGISFITFTLTAYVVDIWRRSFQFQSGPITILGYVLFFPHLIAGPILRPIELLPQLDHPRAKPSIMPKVAIAIFTLGLVKKLILADPIANIVDEAYAAEYPTAFQAILAIYGFSIQIYCDFSGYTDMAIGLALLLGIRLPNNFFRPYTALSVIDFWRRWHVTLSFWFRDYVYIPLGGSRDGLFREVRNIVVTMVLAGLWHGADWTFVIWGLLHGTAIAALHVAHRTSASVALRALPNWLCLLITFHVVTLAWVFFRAPDLSRAVVMLKAPFAGGGWASSPEFAIQSAFPLILMATFLLLHRFDDHRRIKQAVRRLRPESFWPALALGWILAIAVSHGNSAKFIYFDF